MRAPSGVPLGAPLILLDRKIKGAPKGTPEGARKVAFSDLHKDVWEGAFEVSPIISISGALKTA